MGSVVKKGENGKIKKIEKSEKWGMTFLERGGIISKLSRTTVPHKRLRQTSLKKLEKRG